MNFINQFHFLRPAWLLALLPLVILLGMIFQRRVRSRSWQRVVDARLLPHLLIGTSGKRGNGFPLAVSLGGLLAILALAGPAWRKLEQPVFRQQSALVVVLDLSNSMDAADVKPTRLQRARLKLRDILAQQKEGETALIVYAATPFVVTPLTSDANTIASQINSMSSDLMPAQGARPDLALGLAQQLLAQTGVSHGGVLLIADGIGDTQSALMKKAISQLTDAGHHLSILGVGSTAGAPVPAANGGFVKNDSGAIQLSKLDDEALASLAQLGGGAYRRLSTDDSDFQALLGSFAGIPVQHKEVGGLLADQWRDEGPWLLLPLIPLFALTFRRGYLFVLCLFVLSPMRHADAADWSSLWQRDDQRGQQAMAANQPQAAAKLFQNPEWRAAANYRAGNYQAALDDLKGAESAEADYNRGNALAKLGRLPEAMNAYEQALKKNPQFEDARYNHDLLAKMSKPQQPPSQQQDGKDGKQQNNDQQNNKQDQAGNKSTGAADQSQQSQQSPQQGKPPGQSSQHAEKSHDQHANNGSQPYKTAEAQKAQPGKSPTGQSASSPAGDNKDAQKLAQGQPATSAQRAQQNQKLQQQADAQWLQRIPDDPGGLWRNKFLLQYQKQQQLQGGEK